MANYLQISGDGYVTGIGNQPPQIPGIDPRFCGEIGEPEARIIGRMLQGNLGDGEILDARRQPKLHINDLVELVPER